MMSRAGATGGGGAAGPGGEGEAGSAAPSPDDGRPQLELAGLSKRFGDTVAVDELDLALRAGELLTLLGPSGCGKTTVLRLAAGFEQPDEGAVRFRGEEITGLGPRRRGFGMVFQNYALFPHLDVFENVAFGLRSRDAPDEEVRRRVDRALDLVDLPGFESRAVQELSGGQQQRVALARALAIEPPLLLLDEPLSNLDAALRERTRTELRLLVKELGITTLFVTHDQEEAFDLSDRVAVMDAGRIRQTGTPEELYDEPADPFVAGFVGRANRLRVRLAAGDPTPGAVLADGTSWPLAARDRIVGGLSPGDEEAELWVRPEDLTLLPAAGDGGEATGGEPREPGRDGAGRLVGTVRDRRFRGAVTVYRVEVGPAGVVEVAGGREETAPGREVAVAPRPEARLHLFPRDAAPPPPGSRAREGEAGRG